jgi:DNA-binding protein YbaB
MSSPLPEQIEQAMGRLKDHRARMEEVRAELRAASASVTSKDRMVTASVGPQGQVVSLTFHTTAYRSMAPAELAGVLVDVLNEARARIGEQVVETMRSVSGIGEVLRHSMTGGTELEKLLAPLYAMRPDASGEEPGRKVKKQEHFNG